MSTVGIVDCVGGASGNMLLGAFIDAGAEPDALRAELGALGLSGWRLEVERVRRGSLAATHVRVVDEGPTVERHLSDILSMLGGLPDSDRGLAQRAFERLAEVEARLHGVSVNQIHFHEVGAVDSIVDIVGCIVACRLLGIETLYYRDLPVGRGTIRCAHGELPNPAPATLELMQGVPLRQTEVEAELVTPTGALLLGVLGRCAPPPHRLTVRKVGYGAGTRELVAMPNVLRLALADTVELAAGLSGSGLEEISQLETNIDDMNPQIYEHVMDRLFAAGALDVFLTPVLMKKNRPATLLTALVHPGGEQALLDVLLTETTTLGVRWQTVRRVVADRKLETVETSLGPVRVKVAHANGRTRCQPEYEDCRRLARERNLPLLKVIEMVHGEAMLTFSQAVADPTAES